MMAWFSSLFSPFIAPWAFALLALGPVIVLFYLLKLKRRPVKVPSTLLWRRSVQDLVANAPFQKLRNNILLWLQLLILLLLVIALTRPIFKLSGLKGETVILLLDQSASMQAKDQSGVTRFEKAKKLALEAVDGMSAGSMMGALGRRDEMMVIGFSNNTVPLQPMTSDKALLRAAIQGAEPTDTETDMSDAGYILQERTMRRVENGLQPDPDARVILISDGGLGPTVSSLADILNLDYSVVGDSSDNVGITGIDVRESFGGDFEYQLFTTLYNASDEAKTLMVELDVEGEVLDLKSVQVPARGAQPVIFTIGESVTGLATVKLNDNVDSFALDDLARANISPPTELKTILVTRGNSFLQGVLSTDPRVNLNIVRPGSFTPTGDADITIFDNNTTTGELPPGNFLFINALPPEDIGFRSEGERAQRPEIIDWNRVHPITRYANFQRVLIQDAMKLESPKGSVALIEAAETDLVSLYEQETRRVLVIGFDVKASYWPVDVSFPIFFSNLIDYWSRTGRGMSKAAYATGESVPIVPPREAKSAVVTTPAGTKINYNLEGQSTIYLTDTAKAGVYTVAFDKGLQRQIPVNVLSALESDIKPVNELSFGGRKISGSKDSVKTRQEVWPWLVLAALLVLMVEWMVYCRRTFM
ncbi:MAG TPA: BatA and WFA domain-containing protein [Candidatus Sumerlaeota bacterium]|nr:BatA and WFA domain-containing protein [Candidatus Sumerlaeota bacterium]